MDYALEKDMSRGSGLVEWDATLDGENKVGKSEHLAVEDGNLAVVGGVGNSQDRLGGNDTLLQPEKDKTSCEMLKL